MVRRTKVWLTVAVLFGVVNVGGAVMAAIEKEPMHAAAHVVLALLSAYVVRVLMVARQPDAVAPGEVAAGAADARLAHLELSLAGLATGVDRMREGNRSVEELLGERCGIPELRADAERD